MARSWWASKRVSELELQTPLTVSPCVTIQVLTCWKPSSSFLPRASGSCGRMFYGGRRACAIIAVGEVLFSSSFFFLKSAPSLLVERTQTPRFTLASSA